MKRIHFCLAFLLTIFTSSCQQAFDSIQPNSGLSTKSGSARLAEELAVDPDFYSIVYSDHGDLTVNQYIKRARKSGISIYNLGNELISNIAGWNSGSHTSIQNQNRNDLVSDLNSSSKIPAYVPYSGKYAVVFRGGNDFTPSSSSEYRFVSPGVVRGLSSQTSQNPARGVSCELNVNLYQISSRGAYKITFLPSGLSIKNQGRADHFEIVPTDDMPESTYLSLLNQIQSEAAF